MKRLTRPDSSYYDDMDRIDVEELYSRLVEYENLGFTPEDIAYLAKFFKEHTSTEAIAYEMKTAAKLIEYEKWKASNNVAE